jgi:hypothetical protein
MKITVFWAVTPSSLAKFIDVWEEHTASIFRVEEYVE